MRYPLLALGLLLLAGCGDAPAATQGGDAEAPPVAPAPIPTDATAETPGPEPKPVAIAEGAPAFAPAFPGAAVEQSASDAADGSDGGLVVFTTDAAPDEVISFYKAHAEAEGLASTMNMTHGDTRAYGAADPEDGDVLSVVASPAGETTSVQLTWSEGPAS